VPNSDLSDPRKAFLTAHLEALALAGRRLAGEEMSFTDEVAGYFQVRIELVDTDVYAQAHDEISGLLGGTGSLADRFAEMREAELCPPELVERAVRAVAAELRTMIAEPTGLAGLPETISFEIEQDAPWSGFNYYLGDFTSRVAVNAGQGHRMSQLGVLVAHECYPGHHTEHCRKEDLLVNRAGEREQTIFLVNTPQCLMAEGLGDLALTAAVGPGWGRWLAEVLHDIGPRFDAGFVEALELAARPLNTVRQNAAILLHDRGADPEDVVEYMRHWSLATQEQARHRLRFLTDPLWRAYTSTYVEGDRLLRPWLAARDPNTNALQRFQRLLDEPLTPAMIRAELADAAA
jgi:hypothetical protein